MASLDTSQMEKLVDPLWRAEIEETDKVSAPFMDWLDKRPGENANILGQKVKVRVGYNESESGSSFNGGSIAIGGSSQFENIFIPYGTINSTGDITKEAIDNDDEKSKYHPVVQEVKALMDRAMQNLNRAAVMDDGSGRRAIVTANYSGGDADEVVCAPNTGFGNKGTQFLGDGAGGKVVQFCDPSTFALRVGSVTGGKVRVVANNKATGEIEVETLAGVAQAPTDIVTGDLCVPEGMAGRGVHGIEYWVKDTGSIGALALANHPGLKSQIVDGSSGSLMTLVEKMFSKLANKIDEDKALGINGAEKHQIFWAPCQREKYRREAQGLGIAMLGSSEIDQGYGHTEKINGYKATVQGDHSNTRINFLRKSDWYRIQRGKAEKPFERYSINGQPFFNYYDGDGNPTYKLGFNITGYFNVACKNTRDQAAITSLPTSGLETGNS
ncbi:MAG: hypothetical protein KF855_03385 [Acidobacteria bacterium]|nr:hypothetical protein [Acidobacteriota bacterium]